MSQQMPIELCQEFNALVNHPTVARIATVVAVALIVFLLGRSLRVGKEGEQDRAPRTAVALVVWAGLSCTYVLGRVVEAISSATASSSHALLSPEQLARTGVIERFLLDRPLTAWLMPLSDRPVVALVLHGLAWGLALLLLTRASVFFSQIAKLPASTDRANVPWYFRATACTTTRGLDASARAWLKPLALVLGFAVAVAIFVAPISMSGQSPALQCYVVADFVPFAGTAAKVPLVAPGTLVLALLLSLLLALHLELASPAEEKEEREEESENPPPPSIDPLNLLRQMLAEINEDANIAADDRLIHLVEDSGRFADPTTGLPRLFERDIIRRWLPEGRLYETQARTLDLVHRRLALAPAETGDAGESTREFSDADALVLGGADGCGRSTLLVIAAVLARLERGGTALIVCRDQARVEALWALLQQAITGSALRWVVDGVRAGVDLSNALAIRRRPSLIITDLSALEESLLLSTNADRVWQALDFVAVDELHEFIGPAEMHLALTLRRLWITLDHVERRREWPFLLATMGMPFDEASGWATGILGRQADVRPFVGPKRKARVVLRRSHLKNAHGGELSLVDIVGACDAAGLPWHLRMSGDGQRGIRRVSGGTRDPRDAVVVLLEGSFGEAEREIEVTSLVAQGTDYSRGVQIAAPPLEEELALEPLGTGLPWRAISLDPPREMRLAHVLRATSVRPLRLSVVLGTLLSGRHANDLDAWIATGTLNSRSIRILARSHFQPELDLFVERSASAPPLPVLHADCVSEQLAELIDTTGQTLQTLDAVTAQTTYYPGAAVLLREGRFRIPSHPDRWRTGESGYAIARIDGTRRTVPERRWTLDDAAMWRLATVDRTLGRRVVRCRSGDTEIGQCIESVRVYGESGDLLEVREVRPVVDASITGRAILLAADQAGEAGKATLRPIVAALAMTTSSVLRGARSLIQVALVEDSKQSYIGFLDRTPGGSGASAAIDDCYVATLLQMAREVLTRLPDELLERVRARHDETTGARDTPWDLGAARAWLASVVERPESGAAIDKLPVPPADPSLLRHVRDVFPAANWYPPEELALFLETVRGCLDTIPMRPRSGAHVTESDRLCAAAGLASVFYRRTDVHFPAGFYIAFEPGSECFSVPGAAGYCRVGTDWQICIAVEALRDSIALDENTLMPHEAAHLFDALDGALDGRFGDLHSSDQEKWMELATHEIPRAANSGSVLAQYAGTSVHEFLAEAVGSFVERPDMLSSHLPTVYKLISETLRQHPAKWERAWRGNDDS